MTSIDSMTSKSMLSDAAGGWQTGTTGLIAGTFPDYEPDGKADGFHSHFQDPMVLHNLLPRVKHITWRWVVVGTAWPHRGSREEAANLTLHANKLHSAGVVFVA